MSEGHTSSDIVAYVPTSSVDTFVPSVPLRRWMHVYASLDFFNRYDIRHRNNCTWVGKFSSEIVDRSSAVQIENVGHLSGVCRLYPLGKHFKYIMITSKLYPGSGIEGCITARYFCPITNGGWSMISYPLPADSEVKAVGSCEKK